ncbi:MAG: ubiquinol-cytochrome c reductase iron-sulfur subunit [Anaerolineales bacterium]|jgi:Rieske Fe-S protein
MKVLSRRDFLKISTNTLLTLSGLLGLGGLMRFLSYTGEAEQPEVFDLGPVENYPIASHTVVADGQYVLTHDQAGFSAVHMICTHLGCRLSFNTDEFSCPCHGSHFDVYGNVLHGPAVTALDSQPVEPDENGHLILQSS